MTMLLPYVSLQIDTTEHRNMHLSLLKITFLHPNQSRMILISVLSNEKRKKKNHIHMVMNGKSIFYNAGQSYIMPKAHFITRLNNHTIILYYRFFLFTLKKKKQYNSSQEIKLQWNTRLQYIMHAFHMSIYTRM